MSKLTLLSLIGIKPQMPAMPDLRDFSEYTVADFVGDPFFRDWVLRPDSDHEEFWQEWCRLHPEKVETIDEARRVLFNLGLPHYQLPELSISTLWSAIQADIQPENTKKVIIRKSKFWYIAASILILMGVSYGFWSQQSSLMTYRTAYGETREITLPDQSKVILNSNSTLEFEDNWSQKSAREIYVSGEAFFSVIHLEDDQPFKVFTGKGVAIEVLGTEFNVYHREDNTKVVLSSGAITLSFPMKDNEGKILMKPNELVEFKESKYKKKEVNAADYVSWTKKVLNLDETSLGEMIQKAKDNYGIEVKVADEALLIQTASGSMPITDADAFMNQISKIFNVEIIKTNNNYFIKN
jgi:ferric-dicitrate binding protein FerR (iron transport regulator)